MNYFAYGSNMDAERLEKERGIYFFSRKHAILRGWRLMFNKVASANPAEGYANIVPDEDSVVEGVLYEIADSDIESLDSYEGYPRHYRRIRVEVELDDGQKVEAVTYVAQNDKIREGLKPSRKYLNYLLKACDLLSEEYCERLRKQEVL